MRSIGPLARRHGLGHGTAGGVPKRRGTRRRRPCVEFLELRRLLAVTTGLVDANSIVPAPISVAVSSFGSVNIPPLPTFTTA